MLELEQRQTARSQTARLWRAGLDAEHLQVPEDECQTPARVHSAVCRWCAINVDPQQRQSITQGEGFRQCRCAPFNKSLGIPCKDFNICSNRRSRQVDRSRVGRDGMDARAPCSPALALMCSRVSPAKQSRSMRRKDRSSTTTASMR